MAPPRAASNIEELCNRLRDTIRNGKPTRNEILHKHDIKLLLDYKDNADSIRLKLDESQHELDCIQRIVNAQKYKVGVHCTEARLKNLLELHSECSSELTQTLFRSVIFKETMRMAIHDLMTKAKTAEKMDISKISSGKPAFYNILKPKMRQLSFSFDKELENAAKLSLWISNFKLDHSPSRRPSRQTHRKTGLHVLTPKPTCEPATPRDNATLAIIKQCHTLLNEHTATRQLASYQVEANLPEKVKHILTKLQEFQDSRVQSATFNSHDYAHNAPPEILLADGDDVVDCPLLSFWPQYYSPDHPISRPLDVTPHQRMMSANSEDMITLVVCKKLTSIGGQWKELYRKLMFKRYSGEEIEVDILGIVDKPRTEESQAFDALRMWKQSLGRSIRMDILKLCLEELKRKDIVLNICDYEERLCSGTLDTMSLCALCKQLFT